MRNILMILFACIGLQVVAQKKYAEKDPETFSAFNKCTIESLKKEHPFTRWRHWDIIKSELLD